MAESSFEGSGFYPRNALHREVFVIVRCLSVRLSVTRWYYV